MNRHQDQAREEMTHDLRTGMDEPVPPTFRKAGLREVLVKLALGVVFSASAVPVFPIIVAGWLMRFMRRHMRLYWRDGIAEFRAGHHDTPCVAELEPASELSSWPSWIMADRLPGEDSRFAGRIRRFIQRLFGGLIENFREGLAALATAWVVTLPAGALWAFSWYTGWNNSFNKGYEQAAVGPLTGLLGIALFVMAMSYLPLAQARQASAESWRAFFDFKAVRAVIRSQGMACAALALCYALFGVVVMVLLVIPGFIEGIHPPVAEMSQPELRVLARRYYLGVALFGFPCLVVLRLFAARIYAQGIWGLAIAGSNPTLLSDSERKLFAQHPGGGVRARSSGGMSRDRGIARVLLWPIHAGASVVGTFFWFAFSAQIYIGQFLYFKPVFGWLNHPLVQLPRFFYWP